MTDRPLPLDTAAPSPPRRIVVHAALHDGAARLFALTAARAREAVAEIAGAEAGAGWEIVEQEAEVIDVPLDLVADAEGAAIRWACPACGTVWHDPAGPDDEFPVLLLCDCDGTADTWCLGHRVTAGRPDRHGI